MDERAIELLVALLADQVPQAPGSEASTLRALRALEPLPPDARIADLGCGRGASAAVLARRGHVLGVDLLPEMVAATRARGVDAVVGDIAAPPIAPGTLDLVWSEGAAYAIGFAEALRLWRPLLKPGGGIGVTELCSLSDDVPDFWKQAYPAMRTADACRQVFVDAGYTLLDSFLLPRADWAAYYEPAAARLPAFRARHAGDVVAQAVADELQAEIASWRESGDTFGYLFLVGRT